MAMAIDYSGSPFRIRDDLTIAHANQWWRLAAPGTWWNGAERVAVAAEVRNAARCDLCAERKRALSPYAVPGSHPGTALLSPAAVDVVHRVTTDPGRLTRDWFDHTRAAGVSDGAYVELIGVIVTVVSIDSFCRGLGIPLHPLPAPMAGKPSRYRPAAARLEGAWVPMLPNGRNGGSEADLWDEMPGGRTANVIRALSLVPDEVRGLKELGAAHYLSPPEMLNLRESRRALDRRQIELVAGRVSASRGCFY